MHCLEVSKQMTVSACVALEWYYSDIHVVFSGKNGFHIHVLDFDIKDWTKTNYRNLVKTHEVARFRFSKMISLQTYCFDRAHFILNVDPMRIITVPNTLNAETGLVCSYMGGSKDLELQTVENILVNSQPVNACIRVANTMDETCDLLEARFEYVTDMDDAKIFRKRK